MRRVILFSALALFSGARANADLITYEFSGIVSGTLGGGDLEDAPFLFTLTADTSGVTQIRASNPNILVTQDVALNFSIAGVSGTFQDAFHVFRTAFSSSFALIGLSPESGDDLIDISDPSLAAYDLKTSFGPLTQAPPDFLNPGEAYATTVGDLILREDDDTFVTFRATLRAVPEPASMTMTGLGLAGVYALRRRRLNVSPV